MIEVPLKNLCQIRHGGTPSKENPTYWRGSIPWVSPKDMKAPVLEDSTDHISDEAITNSATSLVPAGTILVVARSGILVHSLPVSRIARPMAFNQDIKALLPDSSKVDPEYLYWFVRGSEAEVISQGVKKGATVHSLLSGFLENLLVPVPSRDKQRRVVDLLCRAEGIVRLRREAQAKAGEITPALFVDMFGDPATNPKGWGLATLRDHVVIPSVVRTPDPVEDADRICIGADSIESNTGKILECQTVRQVLPRSGKYWFDSGDVLYSKIRPYLAKATLAPVDGFCSADMYPLRCVGTVSPRFLLSYLLSPTFTKFATAESVRAQMPKLNRDTLFSHRFPLPPLDLQQKFACIAHSIDAIEAAQAAATAQAEDLFRSMVGTLITDKGP
jgi:type I restriction enzyme S subunit